MTSSSLYHLLIVDDDPVVHQSLKLLLKDQWKIFSVQNPELLSIDRFYHVAFVDMHLDPTTKNRPLGLEVLKKIHQFHPQTELIAISGDLNPALMEECLKAGATRFLAKPFGEEELQSVLSKIQSFWQMRSQDPKSSEYRWIGKSPESEKVLKQISELRHEFRPILIEGETGTGKEVVAHLLNLQEMNRPFVPVNMASIPEHLFESEFFGHVKGSFTGADTHKLGLVELANGGDLFLDEIEALSLPHQAKLLRFLETGEFRKVGGKETQKVHCRVISASNIPLQTLISSGQFREDLYFRISTHKINLMPLRQRGSDLSLLADYFLNQVKGSRNKSWTPEALESLATHSWPGNVRELKRVCEQLALSSPLPVIRKEDVQSLLGLKTKSGTNSISIDLNLGINELLFQYERQILIEAIKQKKDVKDLAQILKISSSNLYKKIDEHDLKELLK